MDIIVIGISHHTAPIEIREKLAISRKHIPEALQSLKNEAHLEEVLILSTCNRVEIYAATNETISSAASRIRHFLSKYHNIPINDFAGYLYSHHSMGAVKHLFRVVCSLDSMILGEAQILGQTKEAYELAKESGHTSTILNALFQRAFNVAKSVRSTTTIGEGSVSISSIAVDLAVKIFGELKDKNIMVIGAGPMSELTLQSLVKKGTNSVIVSNRHFDRAEQLAQVYHGEAVRFDNAIEKMHEVDIVVSSTGAPTFILNKENLKEVLKRRKNRPILLMDIAVPRDIDPKVNELDNVYLYDIDDLQKAAEENLQKRQLELTKCNQIIESEQQEFLTWYSTLSVKPTIRDLTSKFNEIRDRELQKTLHQLNDLTEEEKEKIAYLTQRITNQILNYPIQEIKRRTGAGDGYFHTEALRDLFDLNDNYEEKSIDGNSKSCPKKIEEKIDG